MIRGRTVGSKARSVRGDQAKAAASVETSSRSSATSTPGGASFRRVRGLLRQVVNRSSIRATSAMAASDAGSAVSRVEATIARSNEVPMEATRRSSTTGAVEGAPGRPKAAGQASSPAAAARAARGHAFDNRPFVIWIEIQSQSQ
jgi:hypothetical protein